MAQTPQNPMNIYLAPMHGVLDVHMRALLTQIGQYNYCVTEFLRVTDQVYPRHKFYTICPELQSGSQTPSGTPVILQLLGGNPEVMAANALRASELGATGIDLNFGCPSPTVNRHAGGAILLKNPEHIYQVVHAVRQAVPQHIPVSTKIRLGYDNTELAIDNAQAVTAANANYLTVHARTKIDGYTHPARWEWLARIQQAINIPVIANGDINSVDDFLRCHEISRCQHIMLGRGALTRPDLAQHIRASLHNKNLSELHWNQLQQHIHQLALTLQQHDTTGKQRFLCARIKQWLKFLQNHYPQAKLLREKIYPLHNDNEILLVLQEGII